MLRSELFHPQGKHITKNIDWIARYVMQGKTADILLYTQVLTEHKERIILFTC